MPCMRWLPSLLMAACSSSVPPVVTVSPLPVTTGALSPAPQSDCRITGSGDRDRNRGDDDPAVFEIFAARRAHQAMLVIALPGETYVTWSQFPSAVRDDRARVEIGGQQHIRYAGYASLLGRTFSLTTRFVAEPGHLWGRAGAPVEAIAYEDGLMVARVDTPFASPKILTVRGACGKMAYVPAEPQPDEAHEKPIVSLASASPTGDTLDLYAAPSGLPFLSVRLDPSFSVTFDVVGRAAGYSRVRAIAGDVEIDAWAPVGQLDEDSAIGLGGLGLRGYGMSGGSSSERGTIARDTPLLVGAKPVPLDGAVVEKDAEIYLDRSGEEAFRDHIYVPFSFVDGMVEAPNDSRLWVAKDAIQ
jgi:hypothetical protein